MSEHEGSIDGERAAAFSGDIESEAEQMPKELRGPYRWLAQNESNQDFWVSIQLQKSESASEATKNITDILNHLRGRLEVGDEEIIGLLSDLDNAAEEEKSPYESRQKRQRQFGALINIIRRFGESS